MLVDTGAELSLPKRGFIPGNIPFHTDRQCELLGTTTCSKTIRNVHLAHRDPTCVFKVIEVTEDGLIGRDIVKDFVVHDREG
jgi:hypothetical protein